MFEPSVISDMLCELYKDEAAWSDATFGPPSERGPIGPLKHLIQEAQEAIDEPTDIMEYADCLLLVLDASRRAGYSLTNLLDAAKLKFDILKTRKYPKPGKDQASHHVM